VGSDKDNYKFVDSILEKINVPDTSRFDVQLKQENLFEHHFKYPINSKKPPIDGREVVANHVKLNGKEYPLVATNDDLEKDLSTLGFKIFF